MSNPEQQIVENRKTVLFCYQIKGKEWHAWLFVSTLAFHQVCICIRTIASYPGLSIIGDRWMDGLG